VQDETIMQGLNDLVGKKVALVDRGFVVVEGRIVYPTATGVLLACDDKVLRVQLQGDAEGSVTVFFAEALRCVREAPEAPEAPAAEQAEPAQGG
jgi:hypothetical protein